MATEVITATDVCTQIKDLIFTEKTFSRSKEDFVWFIKTAIADQDAQDRHQQVSLLVLQIKHCTDIIGDFFSILITYIFRDGLVT